MRYLVGLTLLFTQMAWATETIYPGTPANNDPNFLLNRKDQYWAPPNPNKDNATNPEVSTQPDPEPTEE